MDLSGLSTERPTGVLARPGSGKSMSVAREGKSKKCMGAPVFGDQGSHFLVHGQAKFERLQNVMHVTPRCLSVLEENFVGQHLSYRAASQPAFNLMREISDLLI